ncbi:hypothetical protein JCM15519_27590 [Fundidesulfovibrio butyratiphilus]
MIQGKVKQTMDAKGFSIRDLNKATGLSTNTIHRARGEQFTKCTLETLAVIAGALGVTTKDLYDETQ